MGQVLGTRANGPRPGAARERRGRLVEVVDIERPEGRPGAGEDLVDLQPPAPGLLAVELHVDLRRVGTKQRLTTARREVWFSLPETPACLRQTRRAPLATVLQIDLEAPVTPNPGSAEGESEDDRLAEVPRSARRSARESVQRQIRPLALVQRSRIRTRRNRAVAAAADEVDAVIVATCSTAGSATESSRYARDLAVRERVAPSGNRPRR